MHPRITTAVLSILLLALGNPPGWADQLLNAQISKSPDGRKELEIKVWESQGLSRIEVVLIEGQTKLFETTIPPEKEPRYAKMSWSPSSDAVLVGVNFKSAEDWILIQLSEGKASSTYFDGDQLVNAKMLETLPFRDEIKSSAPVGRVPWKTVQWLDPKQCRMTFIFSGIGYEGTARLLINFQRRKPTFTITAIRSTVDAELWKQN